MFSGRRGASAAGRMSRIASSQPYSVAGNRHATAGNRRIYVGNLAYSVDWKKLKDYFRCCGNVVYADVLTDNSTGKSKGCAIVEYEHAQEAANAIATLNNAELDGRLIFVREDREDRETNGGLNGNVNLRMGGYPAPANLYAFSMPPSVLMNYAPYPGYDSHGRSHFPSNRLYVSNLAWDVTWQVLKDHFSKIAPVVRADVMIDANGRSKGCAIVEFNTAADAMAASNMLNNTELNGRPMFVREDRESENADAGRNNGLHARPPNPECRVYVSNLSWDVSWTDLKDHFKQGGASNVVRADILTEAGGRSKGCGIVEFATPALARRAIETMNNSVLRGRPVFVREDRDVGGRSVMPATSSGLDRPTTILDENRALPTERSPPSLSRGSPSATKLYVGNLDWNVNWPMLKDYFKKAGIVNHAEVVTDVTGKSKGFAIVEMASHEDALNAIHVLNNTMLGSRQINVRLDAKPDSM